MKNSFASIVIVAALTFGAAPVASAATVPAAATTRVVVAAWDWKCVFPWFFREHAEQYCRRK